MDAGRRAVAEPSKTETRDITKPQPGYWMLRLTRGGPEVPAAIIRVDLSHEPGNPENQLDRWPLERLVAYIGGREVPIERVWERRGRAITKDEYSFQLADAAWARQHAPDEPKANPEQRIDLNAIKTIF